MKNVLLDPVVDDIVVFERQLRPAKVACLVPNGLMYAFEAVNYLSQTWGGHYSWLIPHDSTCAELPLFWQRQLEWFDPDLIVILHDIPAALTERLHREFGVDICRVDLRDPFRRGGLSMYAVLAGMMREGTEWNRDIPLLLPISSRVDEWSWPLLGCLGYIDEQTSTPPAPFLETFSFAVALPNTRAFPLAGHSLQSYFETMRSIWPQRSRQAMTCPRDLTKIWTGWGVSKDGRSPFLLSGMLSVVVAENQCTMDDFCLYWNIFPFSQNDGMSLLLSTRHLRTTAARDLIREFLDEGERRRLCLASASMTSSALSSLAESLGFEAIVSGSDIAPTLWQVGATPTFVKASTQVSSRRRDRYPLIPPEDDTLEQCPAETLTRVVEQYTPQGIRYPRVLRATRSFDRGLLFGFGSNEVQKSDGIVRLSRLREEQGDVREYRLPAGWPLIEALFAAIGCRPVRSSHGRRILGLYQMLRSISALHALAIPELRALIELFSKNRVLPHGRIIEVLRRARTLSVETGNHYVNWLAFRHLVTRGVEAQCPVCHFRQFVSINDLTDELMCVGCTTKAPFPLKPDKASWSYRCNELLVHEVGTQGALVPALTFGYLADYSSDNVLAHYPGVEVELSAELAAVLGRPRVELDYVMVSTDGDVFVGECKVQGDRLTADELREVSQIAVSLRATPVFSTLHNFDQLRVPVQQVPALLRMWDLVEPLWLTQDDWLLPISRRIESSWRRQVAEAGADFSEERRRHTERRIAHFLTSEGFG
jgi:hypothetical protein